MSLFRKGLKVAGLIILAAAGGLGNDSFSAQKVSSGLTLEIQVVPMTSLRISSEGREAPPGGVLSLDFGNVDAFGNSRSPGVFVEVYPWGAAYYFPLQVTAGSSGGVAGPALSVRLLPGNSLPSAQFFEETGERLSPGQSFRPLNLGQPSVVAPRITGIQQFNRVIGVMIKPENPAGRFLAQFEYSLEIGGGS
ncbi:MAG: hypothetical protein U1F57_11355 [bacterium]